MKKILAALLSFAATACWATAPIGVCISNVGQTISNGYIAPVPFASVTLCTAGSTASTCAANMVSIYTSTALSTPTPTNPFVADVGGNYFFCAPVGHYALVISGSVGGFWVPDIALVDDWSKGGTVTGVWNATTGFEINSLAPMNHVMLGNGTNYVDSATIPYSILSGTPTFYYQTDQTNGTPVAQAAANNFSPRFTLTPISGATTIDLNTAATGNIPATEATAPGSSTGCAQYDGNGNIAPITANCNTAAGNPADVTGSRSFGTINHNTNAYAIQASGYGVAVAGSGTNNITCLIGPSSPPTMRAWSETNGATVSGGAAGFIILRIPASWYYECTVANDLSGTPTSWIESPTF